jgi:hypothetical protein
LVANLFFLRGALFVLIIVLKTKVGERTKVDQKEKKISDPY